MFTRNPKKDHEEESQQPLPSEPLSPHAPVADTAPQQAAVSQIPVIASQDRTDPGWYPDTTDSGLMRYWDGFHFTGQAKRVSSPVTPSGEPQARPEAIGPPCTDALSIDWSNPGFDDPDEEPSVGPKLAPLFADLPVITEPEPIVVAAPPISTLPGPAMVVPQIADVAPVLPAVDQTPAVDEKPVVDAAPAADGTDEDETIKTAIAALAGGGTSDQDGHRGEENVMNTSDGQDTADGADNWGRDTERAVVRALTVDTPEAWQEAAHVAAVVSEMAQTMQAAADAKQTARQAVQVAEEAAETARVATQTAANAKETAERMEKSAEEAAETARVAAQKAIEAKADAEQKAEAAPKVAEKAEIASRAAAEAKHKAQDLEQLVAKARAANTPTAWSEAHKLAAIAAEAKESTIEAFPERDSDDSPQPPLLWRRSTSVVDSGIESLDQVLGVPERPLGLRQGPQ